MHRVDARDKVTGSVRYGADRTRPDMAYAMLATATVDRGRVTSIDTAAARAVAGVRLVMTNVGPDELASPGFIMAGGYGFQSLQPLLDNRIAYRGQPIALVVADTLVAAIEAAHLVEARYQTEPFAVELDADGADTVSQAQAIPMFGDIAVGDADAAFAASTVQLDVSFEL